MSSFIFKLATLNGVVFEGEVLSLSVPASKGVLGILPKRLPIVATLKKEGGVLKVNLLNDKDEEYTRFFFVKGGVFSNKRKEAVLLTDLVKEVDSYEEGLSLLKK